MQALNDNELRIGLAAPTGKAAARLHESIRKTKESMDSEFAEHVPDETGTLHRLLGYQPQNGTFRYNRENKLHLDLLVLDESSMIDVPLMAHLVDALPEQARLIMLGDRDQLTSVEVGSLFGDICSSGVPAWSEELCGHLARLTQASPEPVAARESFADSVVVLQESFRFSGKSGISLFAKAVNNGSMKIFDHPKQYDDITLIGFENDALRDWLARKIVAGFQETFAADDQQSALASLSRFRILCAVREGESGVKGVNTLAEQTLRAHKMISSTEEWYTGRPVMIRKNHYGLHLFNGDTGIFWPDKEGRMWAWFQYPDGSMHPVAPARLPEHETAYAITVHKSQGSEFEEVVFLLPPAGSRVLCRELVYTGVTRAQKKLTVCGDISLLDQAVEQRVIRYSGLKDVLWKR